MAIFADEEKVRDVLDRAWREGYREAVLNGIGMENDIDKERFLDTLVKKLKQ